MAIFSCLIEISVVNKNRKEVSTLEPLNSAENVLNILFVWSKTGMRDLGLTEISRLTGINKSTVYKILISLQRRHLVFLDPTTKKYRIDYGILELSSIFLKQTDLRTVAHPYIEQLAVQSGKTITLALRKESHLVFIDRVDGCENVRFFCDIGKVVYYNSGAAAKAVFAHLSDHEQQNVITQPHHQCTDHTMSWDQLMCEVPQIRQNGYAISDEEVDIGVFAIGAPIFDAQGKVVAGIAMATIKLALSQEQIENMVQQTLETAHSISSKLGYTGA